MTTQTHTTQTHTPDHAAGRVPGSHGPRAGSRRHRGSRRQCGRGVGGEGSGSDARLPAAQVPVFGAFTLVGVLVGWAGWRIIEHRSARPGRLLGWLVPVVGVLSFVPDVALGLLRFIPGATWPGALGLMVMHVVVIVIAVPAYLIAGRPATSR